MKLNLFLYGFVVLIWGTTWQAITLQQRSLIAPEVAVFWRFLIASLLLFIVLILFKKLKKIPKQAHLLCLLQGCCIFGFNFLCFYYAVHYINSGLEAIIFSLAVLFNAINSRIFFKQSISPRFYFSAALGISGIVALFWHDIYGTHFKSDVLFGIVLCLMGTCGFSLGNMLSVQHQKQGRDIFTTTAYAMLYGAMIMLSLCLILGKNLLPQVQVISQLSILYLAIFGSVIGFCTYFILVGRIGASNAAYSTLLFPLVALIISTMMDGYVWTVNAVFGIGLILLGNAVFFIKFKRLAWFKSKQAING